MIFFSFFCFLLKGGPTASTWAAMMDPEAIESLSKEERKRQEAIYELIYTEQTYSRDLQMIIDVFYGPIQKQNYLTENETNILFSNIEDILLCNAEIFSDLEQRQKEDDLVVGNVGDILIKHMERLRLYKTYCGNQLNATNFLQKKTNEDKRFCDFLKVSKEKK